RTRGSRPAGGCTTPQPAALMRRGRISGLTDTGAALLAAVILLVDGGPGAALRLLFGNATLFVAFLNVLGLTLLLVGIAGFVAPRHGEPYLCLGSGTYRPNCLRVAGRANKAPVVINMDRLFGIWDSLGSTPLPAWHIANESLKD